MATASRAPRIAILAPSATLTVTIEVGDEQGPEIHFHPGGQGVWVARMASLLGAEVTLCTALGGEAGTTLRQMLTLPGIELRPVRTRRRSAAYIHDRRSGERQVLATTLGPRLMRHEADELFGVMLAAGLDADVSMLTGPQPPQALTPGFYRRLAKDLRDNGGMVIADLTAEALAGALAGGVDAMKISDYEAIAEGFATGDDREELIAALVQLRERGARNAVISRGASPALAIVDESVVEIAPPSLEPLDPRGAGDSMFAGLGVGLAEGLPLLDALRLGAAAGALNATRRGLGTASRREVERLTDHVSARKVRGLDR